MKERYLVDYDSRKMGLGHQMGSFNYGLKIALDNDLTYLFHKERFYDEMEEFFRFSEGEKWIEDIDVKALKQVLLPPVESTPTNNESTATR